MPRPYQLIHPDLMDHVRICLAYRQRNRDRHPTGRRLLMQDIVNEIVKMGLPLYAEHYAIPLPALPQDEERRKAEIQEEEAHHDPD